MVPRERWRGTFARRLRLAGNSILDFSTLADRQLSGRIANGVIHRQPAPPQIPSAIDVPRFPSGLGRTIKQRVNLTDISPLKVTFGKNQDTIYGASSAPVYLQVEDEEGVGVDTFLGVTDGFTFAAERL